jgi:plasmid stabilization system protein ParE
MSYRVIIQPSALKDLDEAYTWLAERSPTMAARWFNRLLDAVNSLARSPEFCGLAAESEYVGREIRQLLYGRRPGVYRVLFVIDGKEVQVLHIRYAARSFLTPEELQGE